MTEAHPDAVAFAKGVEAAVEDDKKAVAQERARRGAVKIQIAFHSKRDPVGDQNVAAISFWESAKRLHGGGDQLIYVCARALNAPKIRAKDVAGVAATTVSDAYLSRGGCGGLIRTEEVSASGMAVCPHCQARHRTEWLMDQRVMRASLSEIAAFVVRFWDQLQGDCDITVIYDPTDKLSLLNTSMSRYIQRHQRATKGIYTKESLIRDTLTGASVVERILAFLRA
jgi:hypothetical protein